VSRLERLIDRYADHISTPWPEGRSGIERVIFIVYAPAEELRLRVHIDELGRRTREAGHGWLHLDLTDAFPRWMAAHRYRDKYFRRPELMSGYREGRLTEFTTDLVQTTCDRISAATPNDVVALSGMGTLFGVSSVSELVERCAPVVPGRLVVFFPGEVENHNYRLLDARDGWGYMAHAINADGT
jgi:hypothetical protein